MKVMTVKEIQDICENSRYGYFGLRADDMDYQAGDICNNSHQLFQDPDFDEFGELIYPFVDDPESPYYDFYDGGELDGTCAVKFNPDDEKSIARALKNVKIYNGSNLYVIAGKSVEYGNDEDEILIEDAEVLKKERI